MLLRDDLRRDGIQLWLEGTRLRFEAPRGALTPEHRTRISAQRSALIEQLAADRIQTLPLSRSQQSLWLHAQTHPDSSAYNVSAAIAYPSSISSQVVEAALERLLQRHPILSATVVEGPDGPALRTGGELLLERVDARATTDVLGTLVQPHHARPFVLHRRCVRAAVFETETESTLLLTAHHLVMDGLSLWVAIAELAALIVSECDGRASSLGPPTPLTATHSGSSSDTSLEFWSGFLHDATIPLRAVPRLETASSGHVSTIEIDIAPSVLAAVQEAARASSVTSFSVLLTAFATTIIRASGERCGTIGTAVHGRRSEDARAIGYFSRLLPLPVRPSPDETAAEAIARTLPYRAGGAEFFGLIAEEAGADIRKHWTPTAENFFSRVSAGHLVDLLCEFLDCDARDERVAGFAKLKKAEKAEKMEKLVSDPTTQKLMGLTPEQKAKLDKWVPDCT